ncbi:hypothetical protein ACFL2Q_00075 [Thermodesulfobacteriota bacterium]
MKLFRSFAQEALEDGLVLQIVVADEEGMIVENGGEMFPPDSLVATFFKLQGASEYLEQVLNLEQASEMAIRYNVSKVTLVFIPFTSNELGSYLISAVIPFGAGYRVFVRRLLERCKRVL